MIEKETSVAFNLLWFSSAYNRKLIKDDISDALIIKIRNAYWLGFFIYLAAFLISFFMPFLGLSISISLWIFWTLLDYDKKKEKKFIPQN
jgi:hypothetical protein